MLRYSDYINNGGTGIIKLLSINQTLNFLLSDDISNLDSSFTFQNGLKTFTKATESYVLTKNDLTPLSGIIKVRYGDKWKSLYNLLPKSTDTIAGEVTQSTGNIESNNENTNQVAGYDSDVMIDDNGNKTTGSNKTNQTVTKTDYTQLNTLVDELDKNNFYDIMFTDITNCIFVQLYGNERE